MSVPPVRPVFSNGQRLTAERLAQAQEYLRDFVRRVCLAPLSAGVAGGFDLELDGGPAVDATTLVIKPGMAIDGKGRLLVVPAEVRVPLATVLANAGIPTPFIDGQGARIAVQLDAPSGGACGDQPPPCIVEAARIFFEREDFSETLPQFNASVANPNCAEPWEDIADADTPDPVVCSITLGNLYYSAPRSIYVVTTFFRQGVEPRFSVLRNTRGQPAIFLTDLNVDTSNLQPLASPVAGVGVPVPALFTSVTAFLAAGGVFLQATQVGPFGKGYAAGAYGQGGDANSRVFALGGGVADATGSVLIAGGAGGTYAVPCKLTGDPVTRAGLPLEFGDGDWSTHVVEVRKAPVGFDRQHAAGLSAGPSYSSEGKQYVLVASGGLIQANIRMPASVILRPGTALEIDPADPETLSPDLSAAGVHYLVARLAQAYDNTGNPSTIESAMVWASGPPQWIIV